MKTLPKTPYLQLVAFAVGLCSCAQLTFSKEEAVDFERYPSVRVSVTSGNGIADTEYLAGELREGSGFTTVSTDATQPALLLLNVTLHMAEEVTMDDEGNISTSWDGEAIYTATDAAGALVNTGSVEDTAQFPSELAEDLLDEVALNYLQPFRI